MGNYNSTSNQISPGGPPLNAIEKQIVKDINNKRVQSISNYFSQDKNIRKEIIKLLIDNISDINQWDLETIMRIRNDDNYELFLTAYKKYKDSPDGKSISTSSIPIRWILNIFYEKKFDLLKILINQYGFTNYQILHQDNSDYSVRPKTEELLNDLEYDRFTYFVKYLPDRLDIFQLAILYGDVDILKFLMEKKFKPYRTDVLFFPIIAKKSDNLKFLLENGYQKNIDDLIDETMPPIVLATRLEDLESVKVLLSNKADINIDDLTGKNALNYAKKGSPIAEALEKTASSDNYEENNLPLTDEFKTSEFSLPEEDVTKYNLQGKYRLIPADPQIRPIPFKISYVITPTNLELYRGVNIGCTDVKLETDSDRKYVYFTHKKLISTFYSKGQCIVTYKTKRNLVLLDLWAASTWSYINALLKKKPMEKTYSGILNKFNGTSIELNDPGLNISNYLNTVSESFPTGKVMDDVFLYRNLKWGPKLGQFKRTSDFKTDYAAIDILIKLFPKIDGFYLTETPSFNHSTYYDDAKTKDRKYTFHSEIILKRPYADKIEFVSKTVGGKRRKTKRSRQIRKKTFKRRSTSY